MSAFLLVLPGLAAAQGNSVRPRITDRVDEAQLAVLQGNTHPMARPQFDQGTAPPSLPMDRMRLVLKRSPEQEVALQDLLEQQQDKSSPNYHKWLTPDQFGQQYGPADQDIQAVTSWLTSQGFQSIQVSKGRTVIEFSGTAAQVQSALHAEIHKYIVNGETHWANAGDPQIPAALAPVVSGVVALHNFLKKPYLVQSGEKFVITSAPGELRQFRNSSGGNAMGPADFSVLYTVGPAMTGAGTTIAVIGRTNINVQDVRDFRTQFGLSANDPQVILNGPDPGNLGTGEETEAVLDVSWSGAVAPSATVKFVVSESTNSADGTDLSEIYIIDNNLADVMTESFGGCEGSTSSGAAAAISALAQQAAAQGITYLVSSGDNGVAGCDDQNVAPATHSASVNVLAATPFTVAVGGTQFNENGNPNTYWATSNTVGTGFKTALSYIPEDVWNESSLSAGLWSSSGGASIFFKPKPSWQSGVSGIPTDGARDVPDVSLTAAAHDPYLLCVRASCTGGIPTFHGVSGTSASVQAFGGIMALVVQKTGARQGQANYVLYKLAASETLSSCNGSSTPGPPPGPCNFYDTKVGNNTVPGLAGFNAETGYDLATGLGSVNVSNLLNNWSSVIFKGSTTALSLNGGTAVNVTHGASVPVSITVAAKLPATGTPTGDVSLVASLSAGQGVDGFTLAPSGGNGSVTSTTNLLPGGTYTVTSHYTGDGVFGASDSTPGISVTINPEASKTRLGVVVGPPCTTSTSIAYGSPYVLNVAVTDLAGAGTVCTPVPTGAPPTGTVTLTDNTAPLDAGTFTLNSLGFFVDKPIQLTAGTHSIKAVYNGDNSFSGSPPATDVVIVSKAATTTAVSPSAAQVATGASVTLTATVATQSNATASAQQEPTQTVQFLVNGTAFGSPVTVTGGVNSTTMFAQATAALTTTTLPNGTNSITAQYVGDGNYSTSTSPAVAVTVGPGFAISFNPTTVTISPAGQKGTTTVTVTGQTGFTGTINFVPSSCSGLPLLTTCNFNPASVTGSGTSLLTISTTAPKTSSVFPQDLPSGFHWAMAGTAVTFAYLFIMLGLFSHRRGVLRLAGVLGFACVMFVCAGCKMLDKGITIPGTPTGTSTVTVTLTGGGVTTSAPFTLTVQ